MHRHLSSKSTARPSKRVRYASLVTRVGIVTVLSVAAGLAFAQASQPVESSVFTHRVQVDDGPQSGAINDNWKYITNPPAAPVAASTPAAGDGQRHGRGGGRGGGGGGGGGGMGGRGMKGTSNASNDTSNTAASMPMPSNAAMLPGTGNYAPTGSAGANPPSAPGPDTASSPHADNP